MGTTSSIWSNMPFWTPKQREPNCCSTLRSLQTNGFIAWLLAWVCFQPELSLSLSLSLLFSHPLGWPGVPLVFSKKDALRLTTHTRTKDVSPTPTSSNLRPARLASKVSSGPVLAAQQQANLAGMDEAGTHQNRRRSQDLRRFLFCRRFLFFQSWMSH